MSIESKCLQDFFTELIRRNFNHVPGLRDEEVQDYIINMLAEFSEYQRLVKIRAVDGRPLFDVGEMLLEADPVYGPTASFDREREVRKHIGDYTLFLSGMFPRSINHFRLRRQRLENFIEFVKAGKESYHIVSQFDQFEYVRVAPLFAKLARDFEQCVHGLNLVSNDIQAAQYPIFLKANDLVV